MKRAINEPAPPKLRAQMRMPSGESAVRERALLENGTAIKRRGVEAAVRPATALKPCTSPNNLTIRSILNGCLIDYLHASAVIEVFRDYLGETLWHGESFSGER